MRLWCTKKYLSSSSPYPQSPAELSPIDCWRGYDVHYSFLWFLCCLFFLSDSPIKGKTHTPYITCNWQLLLSCPFRLVIILPSPAWQKWLCYLRLALIHICPSLGKSILRRPLLLLSLLSPLSLSLAKKGGERTCGAKSLWNFSGSSWCLGFALLILRRQLEIINFWCRVNMLLSLRQAEHVPSWGELKWRDGERGESGHPKSMMIQHFILFCWKSGSVDSEDGANYINERIS